MENLEKETKKTSCEMKTDLNLLLECLKYQMDNPEAQKQALSTVHSICQQNDEASDYFRETGGLMFVTVLAKTTPYSPVKEAALFTLGSLAESSVFCQQALCTFELFSEVGTYLSVENSSLKLKRMAVYILLVLVANNKVGQSYVRESGCLDILLSLFRTAFPVSQEKELHAVNQYYHLWSSVCGTLCACVNNPQNDENQKICMTAFPFAKDCLQMFSRSVILRPVCSFVSLTLAGNTSAQDYFAVIGGLDALAKLLLKLSEESMKYDTVDELMVVAVKTLDVCIAENAPLSAKLAQYGIVSKLLALLHQSNLHVAVQFSIVLAIGHCTETCEENQYHLLKDNGLPTMIQILAESQDEDLSKAATFVLQNCRNLTKQMSDLFEQSNGSNTKSPCNKGTAIKTITDCWEKAENIIQRIERLERQHNEERINCQPSVNDDKVQGPVKIIVSEDRSIEEISKTSTEPTNLKVKFQQQNGILESVTVSKKLMETEQKKQESEVATSDSLNPCIPNKVDTILKSVTAEIIKLSEEMQTENEQKRCCALESSNIFKCPVSVTKKKQLKENMDTDTLALCSDITDEEVGSLLSIPASAKVFRCSGCPISGSTVPATNKFGKQRKKSAEPVSDKGKKHYETKEKTNGQYDILLTPFKKGENFRKASQDTYFYQNYENILLTPARKTSSTLNFPEHKKMYGSDDCIQ